LDSAKLKISIITPSYNQGNYIEQTIRSVIEQDYPNYELIIIDGGSTDNTIEVIKKYQQHIAYWVSEKDEGQADAINKGIAKATGDIFNWLNSDDYLEPGALKVIGNYFAENPEKNVLCGYTHCFYDDDKSTSHTYRMGIRSTATDTMLNIEMNQPGTFYRMEIIKKLNGVNKSLRYIFDNELWFRYLAKYGVNSVGITDKLLAQFRLHKTSKSVYDGFELFHKEANDIWLFIAKTYRMDKTIVANLEDEPIADKYIPEAWDFTNIQAIELEDYFADKYLLRLMDVNNFSLARRGFFYRLGKKKVFFNRMNISVFFKLFMFPGFTKK